MITAVILAGGKGKRMNSGENKVLMKLKKPILSHTIEAFQKNKQIEEIVIVSSTQDEELIQTIAEDYPKVIKIVNGGKTRQGSSYNGVYACNPEAEIILIHDAARPFIRQETIDKAIQDAQEHDASVVGVPAKDTIKEVDEKKIVQKTLSREHLWTVQTPQTFKAEVIRKAHEKALDDSLEVTDDSTLVEHFGYKVKMTLGHYDNIKITTPDDLIVAEKIFASEKEFQS